MELSLFTPPVTYFISYTDGTGGLLLKALMERVVLSYMPFEEFTTDDKNSAHPNGTYANYRITVGNETVNDLEQEFYSMEVVDPERSAFISTHFFDPELFRTRHLGSKTAVITHTEADIEEVTINWIYKATPPMQAEGTGLSFQRFSPYAPIAFSNMVNKDFFSMTNAEKRKCVDFIKGITYMRGYHLLGDISQYSSDVVEFKYQDLMTNPTVVNTQMQALTGMALTEGAQAALDYYQTKQNTFMAFARSELGL
jgi:hypothetical protein